MRFAAIGRHEALLKSIDVLCAAGHELSYILTAKEAPEYRQGVADFVAKGQALGVPVYVAARVDQDCLARMAQHDAEVAVSLNFPTVISDAAIGLFRHGILNAHGGDLPRYRGNACQAWAMINGETAIGLCVHKMVGGELDSGDVLAKDMLPIQVDSRIADVMAWIEVSVPGLFTRALDQLAADPSYVLYRQADTGLAPLRCYPRRPSDGRIVWTLPAPQVVRLINASGPPYSGAFFEYEGHLFYVDSATWQPGDAYLAVAGQVARINADLSVDIACAGEGFCRISEVRDVAGTRFRPGGIVKSVRHRFA